MEVDFVIMLNAEKLHKKFRGRSSAAEQGTLNPLVPGSSPGALTI